MKRVFFAAVFAIICTASFSQKIVAEGKTWTALGDYRIEAMEQPVVINGKELEGFLVSYQNSGLTATIAIEKTSKCKKYYVLSDNLSVQYVCNDKYFGVERLDKKLEKEGYKTSGDKLNNEGYFHQKLITCDKMSDRENSKLIAAYYPFLFKDQEAMLAIK
jgi:uncharacterized CHY-type Zn-finger protein